LEQLLDGKIQPEEREYLQQVAKEKAADPDIQRSTNLGLCSQQR